MYAVLTDESLTGSLQTQSQHILMDAKDSPCLHAHNRISNSKILNNNCFIANWFVRMRTIFENVVANEAIVLQ